MTLMSLYNGPAAVLLGTIVALVMYVLFAMEVIPGWYRVEAPKNKGHGSWSLCLGVLVSGFVMLLWRSRSRIFMDRICVHQTDSSLKNHAIWSLAGLLRKSDRLLILWDPTWTERLWCLFELAAFLKSKEDVNKEVIIRPIFWGPASVASFVMMSVAMSPITVFSAKGGLTPMLLMAGAILLCCLVFFYLVVTTLRSYFRDLDVLEQQLLSISFDAIRSTCCDRNHINESGQRMPCDRLVIKECVTGWQQQLT